jgi:hypothetical protein
MLKGKGLKLKFSYAFSEKLSIQNLKNVVQLLVYGECRKRTEGKKGPPMERNTSRSKEKVLW